MTWCMFVLDLIRK